MSLDIKHQPLEIRQKIKAHMDKIKTLNSTQLLEYSLGLNDSKDDIGLDVRDYLLNAVALRTNTINAGFDVVQQCKYDQMVKDFIKKDK